VLNLKSSSITLLDIHFGFSLLGFDSFLLLLDSSLFSFTSCLLLIDDWPFIGINFVIGLISGSSFGDESKLLGELLNFSEIFLLAIDANLLVGHQCYFYDENLIY